MAAPPPPRGRQGPMRNPTAGILSRRMRSILSGASLLGFGRPKEVEDCERKRSNPSLHRVIWGSPTARPRDLRDRRGSATMQFPWQQGPSVVDVARTHVRSNLQNTEPQYGRVD